MPIRVAELTIPDADYSLTFVRGSGPGGQNVNKVATACQLRFDLAGSTALPDAVKERLRAIAGKRVDQDGTLLLTSQKTRDQGRNLDDARLRLKVMILQALEVPKERRATRLNGSSAYTRIGDSEALIDSAVALEFERAASGDRMTSFHLQAEIASHHVLAPTYEATNWEAIVRAYDALLDPYEPGMRASEVERVFADLKTWLPGLIRDVQARQAGETVIAPQGPFAVDKQRALGRAAMELLGFDFEAGRLDESAHPFCGGVPEDVRMTTRYSEADALPALMGVVHETGHGRYEQNLPREWLGLPVAQARSMGLHESQSLSFEMQLGSHPGFARLLAPHAVTVAHSGRQALARLGAGESFDIIFCAEVLMYVREKDAASACQVLDAHLAEKGLIIEVSQQDRKAGRPKFFHGWDEVLGKYFEMAHRERFDDQDRPYEIVGYQRRQT